jgi:hypothetical protein
MEMMIDPVLLWTVRATGVVAVVLLLWCLADLILERRG